MITPKELVRRPQTVLLLGSRSGIGQAIVRRLVADGARIVLLAGRPSNYTPQSMYPAAVEHLEFDATDTASHADFFKQVFSRHTVDVVIVAFGLLHDQQEVEANPDVAMEMAQVNYLGAASTLLHLAPHLREQGKGVAVVLSSVAGVVPRRSNYVYGSTKAGIDHLARGLQQSLDGSGADVLVVRPGFVHTAMTAHLTARPFAVRSQEVASAVADGIERRRHVIWVPRILGLVMRAIAALPNRLVGRLGL